MKKSVKKIIRRIHLWLGLTSGIVVFIMAITGAIYVFSYEIKSALHKDYEIVEVPKNQTKISLTTLVATATNAFDNTYTFQNIVVPNFDNHSVSISFMETDDEAFGYWNYMKFYKTVHLNPYTGAIIHVENTKWEFFNVMLAVHMNLFLGFNPVSHVIIVWSTWIFVIMLITGIILWWPKSTEQKQKFWFRWKKTSNNKRRNYDLHQILGFYASAFALLIALTGLMWASKSFNTSVKWIANGGKTIGWQETPKGKETTASEKTLDVILNITLTNIPESKYVWIRKHPKSTVPYIVRSYVSESLNFTRIEMFYDKTTAELLATKHFSDKNNGEKVQALNYDLHVGSIGGLPTKILALLVSLIIASLPVTGFIIWYGRGGKRKKRLLF